jgi:hypothetical protein
LNTRAAATSAVSALEPGQLTSNALALRVESLFLGKDVVVQARRGRGNRRAAGGAILEAFGHHQRQGASAHASLGEPHEVAPCAVAELIALGE